MTEEVIFFIMLKFYVFRCLYGIFLQSFWLDARNVFWQNLHAAIFFVMVNCIVQCRKIFLVQQSLKIVQLIKNNHLDVNKWSFSTFNMDELETDLYNI